MLKNIHRSLVSPKILQGRVINTFSTNKIEIFIDDVPHKVNDMLINIF